MSLKKSVLEQRWWHRLAKVVFVFLSLLVVVVSAILFYSSEENNATSYTVIKTFAGFLQDEKDDLARGCPTKNSPRLDSFSLACIGRLLAAESFVSQDSFKSHSLGCMLPDGKVEWLNEYRFEDGVNCDQKSGISCTVSQNVCGGDASKIVKYDSAVSYGIGNYFSIAIKTIGVFLVWFLLVYLIYYKAFLYIIFGGNKAQE